MLQAPIAVSCKAGSATEKGCGRSSQFMLLLPDTCTETKRKKEMADPKERSHYGVQASIAGTQSLPIHH